jgi:hypothetical protein
MSDDPDEQYRILQRIREEQEKKDLELALKASQAEIGIPSVAGSMPSSSYSTPYTNSPLLDIQDGAVGPHTSRDFLISQQKAMDEYKRNRAPAASHAKDDERRRQLLERGTIETQEAISSGRAHIVKCRKCGARLQAPVSYSLVFCPKCETVSPA